VKLVATPVVVFVVIVIVVCYVIVSHSWDAMKQSVQVLGCPCSLLIAISINIV